MTDNNNFDERLNRLIERHEALTQSVELLAASLRETHDITRETAILARQNTESIKALVEVTNQDATAIRTLARIADAHEKRIADLEGGTP